MTLRTLLRNNGGRTSDGKRRLIVVGTLGGLTSGFQSVRFRSHDGRA